MSQKSVLQTRILCCVVIYSALLLLAVARPVFAQGVRTGQAPEQNSTDQQLFEDLKSTPREPLPAKRTTPEKPMVGEDLGAPSKDVSPLAEIGRQMRHVESRLRERDTSAATRQLQSDILERLTKLLEAQERQQNIGKSQTSGQAKESSGQGGGKSTTGNPGGTDTETSTRSRPATDPDSINRWTEQIWGVLPDRIQQRMQSLTNEEFLPQFEQRIQQYYERLAERNKKK